MPNKKSFYKIFLPFLKGVPAGGGIFLLALVLVFVASVFSPNVALADEHWTKESIDADVKYAANNPYEGTPRDIELANLIADFLSSDNDQVRDDALGALHKYSFDYLGEEGTQDRTLSVRSGAIEYLMKSRCELHFRFLETPTWEPRKRFIYEEMDGRLEATIDLALNFTEYPEDRSNSRSFKKDLRRRTESAMNKLKNCLTLTKRPETPPRQIYEGRSREGSLRESFRALRRDFEGLGTGGGPGGSTLPIPKELLPEGLLPPGEFFFQPPSGKGGVKLPHEYFSSESSYFPDDSESAVSLQTRLEQSEQSVDVFLTVLDDIDAATDPSAKTSSILTALKAKLAIFKDLKTIIDGLLDGLLKRSPAI